MEEYTEEQIQRMDTFHKKHQTSVFAPDLCALHASGRRAPKTRGGGLSGRKRSRSEQSEHERGPRFCDFTRMSSKKIMNIKFCDVAFWFPQVREKDCSRAFWTII
jgi:hypothetical protein